MTSLWIPKACSAKKIFASFGNFLPANFCKGSADDLEFSVDLHLIKFRNIQETKQSNNF